MPLQVNGEQISDAELEAELRRLQRAIRPAAGATPDDAALRRQARDIAIGRKLLLQEARRRDLKVTESELQAALPPLIAAAGGPAAWNKQIRAGKIDFRAVVREIADALLVEKTVQAVTQDIPPPSDDEVAYFFAKHTASTAGEADGNAGDAQRQQHRAQLHALKKNQALEEFIAQLRHAALIEEENATG